MRDADAASLEAALTGFGCDTTADDCSARCAEGFLPLSRECADLMNPYQAFAQTCRATERGGSHDWTDDPNTESGRECHDGVDNDGDGQSDCDDPDCATARGCQQGGRGGNTMMNCDTTGLYGALLECTQWSTIALADGTIDESDGFCTS